MELGQLQQKAFELKSEIRILTKKRDDLLRDIESIQQARSKTSKEYGQQIASLSKEKNDLIRITTTGKKLAVAVSGTKERIVEGLETFATEQIERVQDKTKGTLSAITDREKAVTARELNAKAYDLDLQGKQKELETLVEKIEATKRENEVILDQIKAQKDEAAEALRTARIAKKRAKTALEHAKTIENEAKREKIEADLYASKKQEKIDKSYALMEEEARRIDRDRKENIATREALAKQAEEQRIENIRIEDKQQTLKRGFEELQRKGGTIIHG